ncbi:MAG: hypothetical protein DCC52_10210, partial [Chloroflexi bacterium]
MPLPSTSSPPKQPPVEAASPYALSGSLYNAQYVTFGYRAASWRKNWSYANKSETGPHFVDAPHSVLSIINTSGSRLL